MIRKLFPWLFFIVVSLTPSEAISDVLAWDRYDDMADGFIVVIYTTSLNVPVHIYRIPDVTSTRIQIDHVLFPDAQPGMTYNFCLKAYRGDDESACSNSVQWVRPGPIKSGFGTRLEE